MDIYSRILKWKCHAENYFIIKIKCKKFRQYGLFSIEVSQFQVELSRNRAVAINTSAGNDGYVPSVIKEETF